MEITPDGFYLIICIAKESGNKSLLIYSVEKNT